MVIFFALLAAMYGGVLAIGVWTPNLGLDLQGGTRLTMQAKPAAGSGAITSDKMDEAVGIIRQRVNGTGVAEASVSTQGSDQIVVEIPGAQKGRLAEQVGQTAQLRFRLVYGQPQPGAAAPSTGKPSPSTAPSGSPTGKPSPSTSGSESGAKSDEQGSAPKSTAPKSSAPGGEQRQSQDQGGSKNRAVPGWAGAASPSPTGQPAGAATGEPASPAPSPTAGTNSGGKQLQGAEMVNWTPSPQVTQKFQSYTCPAPGKTDDSLVDAPGKPLVTCDDNGYKYLLTPAIIEGTQLSDASSGLDPDGSGYVVDLKFDGSATNVFGDVTAAINGTGRQFAITLDGRVLTAPTVSNGAIRTGEAQISGNFTAESARALANSLKYGALPLTFETQGISVEGPELADNALTAGLLAGVVGLLLVVAYCLFYYRALGLVVIASFGVVGLTVYAAVLLLSKGMGFTLTLPGIAGLIVAIGITADSFIVYFERLRDEVREGKSLRTAVETGWRRARMTILAADGVTFLAALVLYIFAIGVVKGFAFALGLTTLIDVLVVFSFTHPVVALLARTRFFGNGHPLSGLDPKHLGVDHLPGITRRRTSGGVA